MFVSRQLENLVGHDVTCHTNDKALIMPLTVTFLPHGRLRITSTQSSKGAV